MQPAITGGCSQGYRAYRRHSDHRRLHPGWDVRCTHYHGQQSTDTSVWSWDRGWPSDGYLPDSHLDHSSASHIDRQVELVACSSLPKHQHGERPSQRVVLETLTQLTYQSHIIMAEQA